MGVVPHLVRVCFMPYNSFCATNSVSLRFIPKKKEKKKKKKKKKKEEEKAIWVHGIRYAVGHVRLKLKATWHRQLPATYILQMATSACIIL